MTHYRSQNPHNEIMALLWDAHSQDPHVDYLLAIREVSINYAHSIGLKTELDVFQEL